MDDIWYSPEKHGLTIVGSVDDPNASYSFDMLVVWQHENGKMFYGMDSGCSCPSPFEDVKSIANLEPLGMDTWPAFIEACDRYLDRLYLNDDYQLGLVKADITELQAKVFTRFKTVEPLYVPKHMKEN